MSKITSIQDVDHFYEYLNETGQPNSNQSKREYLKVVNSTPELYERYAPGDRAQKEANLSHNLGSNWREYYDYDTGKYKPGFDIKNHDEGRIGIYNQTGDDIGARGQGGSHSYSPYENRMYGEYQSMLNEIKKMREEQFKQSRTQLEKQAENASRQAYILKQQSMLKLPQQNALVGEGGLSESSKLHLDSQYQQRLGEIEDAKNNGILTLEQQKQNELEADILQAQKQLEQALEQQRREQERRTQLLQNAVQGQDDIQKKSSFTGETSQKETRTVLINSLKMMGYTDKEIQEYFAGL